MPSNRIFTACIISSALLFVTNAYDIGCIYPDTAMEPFNARDETGLWGIDILQREMVETPIVVWTAHGFATCQAMCVHYHDPDVKDPYTNQALPVSLPPFGQNAWSMAICLAQCIPHVAKELGGDVLADYMARGRDVIGFPDLTTPDEHPDIKIATEKYYEEGKSGALLELLAANDYDPYTMGHVAGFYITWFTKNDGWNTDGSLQYSPELDGMVPCTGSCRKFQDTIGYAPVPNPRTFPDLSTDESKYDCTGLCRRWQPLQEGDEVGSLKRQEFVVPHIGRYAHTFLREPTLTLSDPGYDLYNDSLQVIEELRLTAGDQYKKDAVELFDNKLLLRKIIQTAVRLQFPTELSFQDYLLYLYGISMAEHDGVVQAWHEKAKHDLVRPTTVIKHWDSDILNTYSGDITVDGPVQIAARDFEALIRVMPHPEFPSGSSCLCTAYMEFTDIYLLSRFGRTVKDFTSIPRDTQGDTRFMFANMTDLRDHCSESRIWGGIHYRPAVPAGEQICVGLGQLAYDYVVEMKNDSTFGAGGPYYRGDSRPTCGM